MNLIDFLSLRIGFQSDIKPVENPPSLSDEAAMLYFKAAAVDTAIGYVANSLANCEFKTFEGRKEWKGLWYYRLNYRPNPSQNAVQLWNYAAYQLMTKGEALLVTVDDDLYVADSFGIERIGVGKTRFRSVCVDGFGDLGRSYDMDEAIYLTFGEGRAKTLINGMFAQYSRLLDSAISGFEAQSGNKWILSLDQSQQGNRKQAKADEEERQDPTSMLQTFMRRANAVYVQSRGQSLEHVNVAGASASDVISIRKDAFEAVASIFKIPPSMLFGNMTNLDEIMGSFLTFTVKPLAKQIAKELTSKIYSPLEWSDGSYVVVDTSRIKFTDIFKIAPSISQLIGSGFSLDEVREQLEYQIIDSEQSREHLITRNYGAIDEVLRQIAQGGQNQANQGGESL